MLIDIEDCPQECTCHGRLITCSHKNLETLPIKLPKTARYLLRI